MIARLGVQVSASKTLRSPRGCGEFAKRFRIRGMTVDVSPISIKRLMATNSLMEWYANVATAFPSLRFSTLMRMAHFGFKAASRSPLSFKHGKRARRYGAMFVHAKMKACNLSLVVSLSVVLRKTVSPEVCGVIYQRLKEHYAPKELELPPASAFPYPGMMDYCEYTLYKGWMRQYLDYLHWYCLLDQKPDYRLDAFLEAPTSSSTWYTKECSDISYGITCKIYDWCLEIMGHPPRLLTLGSSIEVTSFVEEEHLEESPLDYKEYRTFNRE